MKTKPSFKKILLVSAVALFTMPVLGACELTQNYMKHDRENNFEPQDNRDALVNRYRNQWHWFIIQIG